MKSLLWRVPGRALPGLHSPDAVRGINASVHSGGAAKLVLAILWLGAASVFAATKPNILVILADDAGYADFGFQGGGTNGEYAKLTPNLDRLATNGVRFSSGYVSAPICCPSRAGLLTGRYQQRLGIHDNFKEISNTDTGLPVYQPTLADRLRGLGYRTYAIGKWHLGSDTAHHPNQRGFDEFFGFLGGARNYGPATNFMGQQDLINLQRNGTYLEETNGQPYLTDFFGLAASNYVATHRASFPNNPFFMYLAFNAVHRPNEALPSDLANTNVQAITDSNRQINAAMTLALDRAVGMVLNQLTNPALATNTLVVFVNDNGGPEQGPLDSANWSDNGPLRGGKDTLYEGGIRVPFLMSWPGTIPTNPGGRVIADPVITLDLLPTFIAAASTNVYPEFATDGVNLLPRLTGLTTNPIQRCLFWQGTGYLGGSNGDQSAVRQGDWKLYRGTNGVSELYNLASDIGENNNLAAVHPEKVTELLAAHAEWERGVIESLFGRVVPAASPGLQIDAAPLGYVLEKTTTGVGYMTYEMRESLFLSNDWTLTWSMESASPSGNGFVVVGDGQRATNLISAGLDLGSLMLSIFEPQTPAGTNRNIPGPLAATYYFQLSFRAATRTLTLRYGTNTTVVAYSPFALTHVLSGNYGNLRFAGYGLGNARTHFSPINLYTSPEARGSSPSWARLKMKADYTPGTYDTHGHFMGGTELMSLVVYSNRLFAGVGYWNDEYFIGETNDPFPGAQVLVKDSATSPWRQDVAFGTNYLRTESLRSFTFTTDKYGTNLNPPVTLLLAGTTTISNHYPITVNVWSRNGVTGEWRPTSPGSVDAPSGQSLGLAAARFLFDHVDRVTGIHHLFCAFGSQAEIVRGGYNRDTGLIDWDTTNELTGSDRVVSGGELNGFLYVGIASDGNPNNKDGGLFWREDGTNAQWHFIYEWPKNFDRLFQDVRGFTALPHPKGFGYDVGLVGLSGLGIISRIDPIGGDPRNGHRITEELNMRQFLGDEWRGGVPIEFEANVAYNDMPQLLDPATGELVRIMGMDVHHPAEYGTIDGNSAWYLIRHLDATYELGQAIDPTYPAPGPFLRSGRAERASPFAGEERVVYLGGFDAATNYPPVGAQHNTAWLYRAELPDETARIRMDGTTPVVSIDTVHAWSYQLEAAMDLVNFQPVGAPLSGSNTVRQVRHTNAPSDHDFYRWKISR